MLQTLTATPRRMAAWVAAGVIIILLAALWLFSVRKPSTQKKPDQSLTKTVFRKKMPQNPRVAKRIVTKKVIPAAIPDKPAAETKSQQDPAAEPPTEPQAPIKIDHTEKEKTAAAEPPTESTAPVKIDQAEEEKTAKVEPPTESTTPVRFDQAEKEKTVTPEPITIASLKKDSRPKAIPQQETEPAPVAFKSAAPEIRREKWLLSQDGKTYTVQVIGVSNEKSMLEFIERNQVLKQNEIAYYESTFKGKPWFQLLYGIFPDKHAARLAANKLPENIRQAGPWIRRLSAVQKAIKN